MTEDYPPVADRHGLRVGVILGACITLVMFVGCVVVARWIW